MQNIVCLGDNREITLYYVKRNWNQRQYLKPGEVNVEHPPVTEPKNHFNKPAFKCLLEKFPELRVTKIKKGIFVKLQIKQLFRYPKFEKYLRSKKKQVWNVFYRVSINFLEKDKDVNYKDLLENMLLALFENFSCNMSLNIHFLYSYLNFLPDNCVQVSDEHFPFEILSTWTNMPQGSWFMAMLADYCRILISQRCFLRLLKRKVKINRKSEAD
ncbi:uncharacterized protein TNIN_318101 [Trichonephila inaurata madagascariensis]|uniref:Uncharacterized protein n=1 Tax=Trichonephila inaurata madagascariensis TaxID=2747483 RepID=A0A8X6YQH0_9ARAC|nr:uncharacterized protein TNIN_318101 [Trichonephila inaurata madagascariensis]